MTPELQSIIEIEQEELEAGERGGWSGLFQPWVRPALIVGCGIAAFTQLSGIEMIVYFAPTILTDNGFSTTAALNVSVGLGLSYLVMQIIGMAIVDKVGRRRLTLIMVPGAAISLFVLGTLFITGNTDRHTVAFIIGSIILFMLFNAGGLQLMGWLTGSEIYPLAVRERARRPVGDLVGPTCSSRSHCCRSWRLSGLGRRCGCTASSTSSHGCSSTGGCRN